jgi:hypothetical protein
MSEEKHSASGADELLLRFESECDPFRYQVGGFCMWPLFRFETWMNIKINAEGLAARQWSRSAPLPLARVGASFAMCRELLQIEALKRTRRSFDVVAFTATNRLRDESNGRFKNIYFDYLQPSLPEALYVYVDSRTDRRPLDKPCIFASSRTVWPRVTFVERRRAVRSGALEALYSDLTDFVSRAGWAEHLQISLSDWGGELAHFLARVDSIASILQSARSRLVLTDCFYDKMWAVAAAKRLGIPVLELQHGMIYDGHMAYTYDPSSASRYKNRMPLPDKILTFGRHFSDILTGREFWTGDQVIAVGFPKMDRLQSEFDYRLPGAGEPLRVLISSQWIIANKLPEFLERASTRLPDNVVLDVRPHPLERDVGAYRRIGGVTLLDGRADFYKVLCGHHVHCSVFSTTLLESIGLGIPTMIIGLPGSESALPVRERSHSKLASTPEEFAAMLTELARNRDALANWHRETTRGSPYFWQPDASANIHALVAGQLGQTTPKM